MLTPVGKQRKLMARKLAKNREGLASLIWEEVNLGFLISNVGLKSNVNKIKRPDPGILRVCILYS